MDIARDFRESYKILVADDDLGKAVRIQDILYSGGYKDIKAASLIKSFHELEGYDIVILDICWPASARPKCEESNYFGLAGLDYLNINAPKTKVILTSSYLFDLEHIEKIQDADSYFMSDMSPSKILEKVSKVTNNPEGIRSNHKSWEFKLSKLLEILELTLTDGRADLFGMENNRYKKLLSRTHQLNQKVQKSELDSPELKDQVKVLSQLTLGVSNLTSIVTEIEKLMKDDKHNQGTSHNISYAERGIALAFAGTVLVTFIILVLNPRLMNGGTLAIVRFLAAIFAGIAGYLFAGNLGLEAKVPLNKTQIRATGAFAAFVLVLFIFFVGVPVIA